MRGGTDVEQATEQNLHVPPSRAGHRSDSELLQWGDRLQEEQVLESPGDISGSVFQPGECVAQKWIILAGLPAVDSPSEPPEKTPPSRTRAARTGVILSSWEDANSHIKSFAPPQKLLPTNDHTLVSCYSTGH